MIKETSQTETLVQMELESLRSCDFNSEEAVILDLASKLQAIVGKKPVITLGRSHSVSDAFLERAELPRSQSTPPQLNSLLYKNKNPDWQILSQLTAELLPSSFVIVEEFSFSGTKAVATVIRLLRLRLGLTNFQFVALVSREGITTEEQINQIKELLNEEDQRYLEEHMEEVKSRIKILQRKKTLLKKLGTFTNIVSSYQTALEQGEIPKSSIFSDKRITTSIAQKLEQITGRV